MGAVSGAGASGLQAKTSIIDFRQRRDRPWRGNRRTFNTTASGPNFARICATASSADAAMNDVGSISWVIIG